MAKRALPQSKAKANPKKRKLPNSESSRKPSANVTPRMQTPSGEMAGTSEDIGPPAEVGAADRLEPIDVSILWNKGRGEMQETLDNARENNITLPDLKMRFKQDPRLFKSTFAFKDSIRRMYNCQEIGMNIKTLELSYRFIEHEVDVDLMRAEWRKVLEIFNGEQNSNFIVHVVFQPTAGPGANIFESFEVPPPLRSWFDTQKLDVRLNKRPIAERKRRLKRFLKNSRRNLESEIGNAPEPKRFSSKKYLLRYYSNFDVRKEEERRDWQKDLLANLSCNAQAAQVTLDKLPVDLNNAEKISVSTTQGEFHRRAVEEEPSNMKVDSPCNNERSMLISFVKDTSLTEAEYIVLQKAFSGTDNRSGPPVDICLQLLMATEQDHGLYKSEMLAKFTNSQFYHYQISGAVGIILKLYGHIDPQVLLESTNCLDHPRAEEVREAAAVLNSVCLHGAILADETGFGKTKQSLLAAVLHTFLYNERDRRGNKCHRPILLTVPPTLISQWLAEIRTHWPWFFPILSYEDPIFQKDTKLTIIPAAAMRNISHPTTMPSNLKYVFDIHEVNAGRSIIITSYTTHRLRAGHVEEKRISDLSDQEYFPCRFQPQRKAKDKVVNVWETHHGGRYSLWIADEAQKVKNKTTDTWAVMRIHNFPKTILATATPMFNAASDLVGLVSLLWPAARETLSTYLEMHPDDVEAVDMIKQVCAGAAEIDLPGIDLLNPIRIEFMNPASLTRIFNSRRLDDKHLRVATQYCELLDMISIQRSQGSALMSSLGERIPLKSLFKTITYKTAATKLFCTEELEYQLWHREAAKDYSSELMLMPPQEVVAPRGIVLKQERPRFFGQTTPLRRLGMAAFSTKMARLNAVMESSKGNTFVETLRLWRAKQLNASFIHDLTRGEGEQRANTANDLISYLVEGCPVARLVCQEILAIKALEPVNKEFFGHHQKLIVGEVLPANAFYLQEILRACLIDARVFHADLSHQARSQMVDLFNNPQSTLKVLIMLYDVGSIGLNLHKACNHVVIASLPRSRGQESQLAGRASRITSEFPLTVVRRVTPNSHDQFRSVRQAEKAALQLAANARDPCITELVLKLLNEFQQEVDKCYEDPALSGLRDAIHRGEAIKYFQRQSGIIPDTKAVNPFKNQASASTDTPETAHSLDDQTPNPTDGRQLRARTGTDDNVGLFVSGSEFSDSDSDDGRSLNEDDPEYYNNYTDSEDEELDGTGAIDSDDDLCSADADYEDEEDISELEMFLSECQPDDLTRHHYALLQYGPGREWEEDDLLDNEHLKLGLRLLYNKISGLDMLHLTKSIHILYKQFPKAMIDQMGKVKNPDTRRRRRARKTAMYKDDNKD
ncbi:uncharacterized protein DSM5745_10028 [Aspergillus mulundensis]|uniref:Helicase ATP-binding domain-containing protein n=1 Tax=Aspergillus mulundensis TaxID=1810919 RepID=A0A3D8QMB6_9EURO|nr:hypothetical protein DSM5745_10028 [Aspergillus mulundensis]RDW62917.1 hypothetical protein DSM5745_10028 [Aspergillus mulundensis]